MSTSTDPLAQPEDPVMKLNEKLEPIKLNVGGKTFLTTKQTLTSESESFFSGLLSGAFGDKPNENGEYFIDRSHKNFHLILEHLRGNNIRPLLAKLSQQQLKLFQEDCNFFQIKSLIGIKAQVDKWGFPTCHTNPLLDISFTENNRGRIFTITKTKIPPSRSVSLRLPGVGAIDDTLKDDDCAFCFGDPPLGFTDENSIHSWEVEILSISPNGGNIRLGFMDDPKLRDVYDRNPHGWASWIDNTGKISGLFGCNCTWQAGDVIRIEVWCTKNENKLEMLVFMNGCTTKFVRCCLQPVKCGAKEIIYPCFSLAKEGDSISVQVL